MDEKERIIELVRQEILTLEEALELLEASGKENDSEEIINGVEADDAVDKYSKEYQREQEKLFEELEAEDEHEEETAEERKIRWENMRKKIKECEEEISKKEEALLIVKQRLRELEVFAELDDLTHEMEGQKETLIKNKIQLESQISALNDEITKLTDELSEENAKVYIFDGEDDVNDFLDDVNSVVKEVTEGAKTFGRKLSDTLGKTFKNLFNINISNNSATYTREMNFSASEFESLYINTTSGFISIEACDNLVDEVQVVLALGLDETEEVDWEKIQESVVYVRSDGRLSLRSTPEYMIREVLVRVPNDFRWSSCDLKTTSGDIQLEQQNFANLTIKANSGDVELNEVKADSFKINTTSGDVEIEESSIPVLNHESVSGDLRYVGEVGDIESKTISGDILITKTNDSNSDLILSSVSGDLKIAALENAKVEGSFNATSGDVLSRMENLQVNLTENDGYLMTRETDQEDASLVKIDATSVSGDILLKDTDKI